MPSPSQISILMKKHLHLAQHSLDESELAELSKNELDYMAYVHYGDFRSKPMRISELEGYINHSCMSQKCEPEIHIHRLTEPCGITLADIISLKTLRKQVVAERRIQSAVRKEMKPFRKIQQETLHEAQD